MSLLDENEISEGILSLEGVEDAVEPELIPAGDYRVEVIRAEFMKSKSGDPMIKVNFKAHDTGLVNPNIITAYYMMPTDGDDPERKNQKAVQLKRFLRGISYELEDGKLNLAKLDGLIGEANIGIDPAKDGYEESNRLKRWNVAR